MSDAAVPGLAPRLDRVERRQDNQEVTVAALTTTVAVHTEQIAGTRSDLQEMNTTFKETAATTNARIDRLIKAVWAAVVFLVPTAVSLVALALQASQN